MKKIISNLCIGLSLLLSLAYNASAVDNLRCGTFNWSLWNNAYPWGPTHNGSAYMLQSQVSMPGDGTLTIHAQRSSAYTGYHFISGTIYQKQHLYPDSVQGFDWWVDGEFKCSTAAGCWPAMWLTGAWSWPPECDIMEFKGNATCWQNTYITSSQHYSHLSTVSYPLGNWHHFSAFINVVDPVNCTVDYYIDGNWIAEDTANWTDQAMWLIIDFQTEGSSGTATWNDKYMYGDYIKVSYDTPELAPTNPNATAVSSNEIDLSWGDMGTANYNVYQSTTSGGPYNLIASGVSTPSYADLSVSSGTTYYYVITSGNVGTYDESSYSAEVSATTP